jgi:hypothetical protein
VKKERLGEGQARIGTSDGRGEGASVRKGNVVAGETPLGSLDTMGLEMTGGGGRDRLT